MLHYEFYWSGLTWKVGEWTPAGSLTITDKYAFTEGRPPNITLKVLSRIEEPFVMFRKVCFSTINDAFSNNKKKRLHKKLILKELFKLNVCMLQTAADEEAPTGNNRFEGFCVDLLEQIANQVGFNYQIELVQDNNYGALNLTTGEWNGLVRVCIAKHHRMKDGYPKNIVWKITFRNKHESIFEPANFQELMERNADIAVGAMTINFARESVIDFTKPFMNLGISILFKIPSGKPTRLFSFMNPLAVEIWL